MPSRLVAFFVLVLSTAGLTFAASSNDGALKFDIPVVQGAEKYLELLEYPAYLLVALENNGIKTSNMGRPKLVDEKTVQLKTAMLHYVEKKGAIYKYTGSLEWDNPVKHMKFEMPIEIDTSSVLSGNIKVSVFLPVVNFFPDVLVERIRIKIHMLTGPEIQKQMLAYFADLEKKNDPSVGLHGLLSSIMLQSYDVTSYPGGLCTLREPGDAESLSDQAYLFATLAIWFVILPALVASFIFWRKRKRKRKSRN